MNGFPGLVLAVCCLVCLLVGCSLQEEVALLYWEGYSDSINCNTYATFGVHFNSDRGKNITCPYFLNSSNVGSCGDPDTLSRNSSVDWCFRVNNFFTSDTVVGTWSICIYANGSRYVHWSKINRNSDPDKVQVLADGRLNLAPLEAFMQGSHINCSVYNQEGQLCGVERFNFTLLRRNSVEPAPEIRFEPNERNLTIFVGRQLFLCVSGMTLGVRELNWQWLRDASLETINITSDLSAPPQPCLSCDCAYSRYANDDVVKHLLQNKTVDGARGVAFSVLGYIAGDNVDVHIESERCSGVPTQYVSFMMVDDANLEDNDTHVMFNISSILGDLTTATYTIKSSYFKYGPLFGDIKQQTYREHLVYLCNASIPGDSHLEWRNNNNSVSFLNSSELVNRSLLSDATLDELCSRDDLSREVFAVHVNDSYIRDSNGAIYLNQEIALVRCSTHRLSSHTPSYTCFSSDTQAPGPTVTLFPDRSSRVPVVEIAAPLACFVSLLLLVIVVVMINVCVRYSRIKAEPRRMCPVPSHVMSSLISATLTPYIFDEQPDNSHVEFPRENLEFVKVLGEGQFGRVFKAIAEGICPQDSNRKVVAVKTLKENARPSDKDDLRSELDTMRRIEPHPNILNFLGMCSETAAEPLYILMEFAMYGSLKEYLKSVKTGKLPNPRQLLNQQQPPCGHAPHPPLSPGLPRIHNRSGPTGLATSEMTSSVYPTTNQQSTLSLCPYHQSQLTQFNSTPPPTGMGTAPGNQRLFHPVGGAHAADESVSLYDMDPVSRAHATRLLRLLNSEYCLQHLADDIDCCHSDAGGGATIQSGHSAYSYRQLGETCARRACLDDYPYWYGTLPRFDYYNTYYNYRSTLQPRDRSSESPLADVPGTVAPLLPPPPIYVNVYEGEGDGIFSSDDPLHQECTCHERECTCYPQPSPSSLNQYSNLSASNTCVYCCQCGTGDEATQPLPTAGARGADDRSCLVGEGNSFSESERGLSYFEVLDFAQQIARGMEHLEKMKCVHRDLAARNVLIAEGFLLKIGDFGLARDLSEKDYYRKVTPGRIPARWMALESLEERTHTSKSDVWAYGVVLWEVLTYGELPYGKSAFASGIEPLAAHIKAGHRLPQPVNCSDQMYGLLKMCWEEDPELRPSFGQLVDVFTTLLESTQEYFSLSMEDAVHQPMTACLEATAVAGIYSSGPVRAAAEPTILTSPYGEVLGMGSPVHSTSYIDEPESTTRDGLSLSSSPEPTTSNLALPIDQGNAALSQSYLNLIADSANHNGSNRSSDAESVSEGVATNGACASEFKGRQHPVGANGINKPMSNGRVVTHPPDVVPNALRQKTVPTSLTLEEGEESEQDAGRTKVKHGHSRARQRNIHCLETAV